MAAPSHNPYSRSANPSTRYHDSSSASAATSPRPPYQSWRSPGTGGRANAAPLPHPIGIPPISSSRHPHPNSFQAPYTPVTAGFMMGRDSLPSNDSGAATPGLSSAQLPLSGNSQKRAYRQRRKDPSCDACRERKVKCDATETSSCSECTSRNVKCQFTKETNRRMSSIKQVQDLEKQMDRLRRENSAMRRALEERGGRLDMDVDAGDHLPFQLGETHTDPKRKSRHVPMHGLGRIRHNIKTYSRGVWKAPPGFRRPPETGAMQWPKVELPPKALVDQLLLAYYTTAHTIMPILHWRVFQESVDDLYKPDKQPDAGSTSFMSMFFAVLAVGSIFGADSHLHHRHVLGIEMLDAARQFVDAWADDYALDHARAFVLISYYLSELKMKSAACTWLGMAVGVAHDLALHLEVGPWPFIEGEMRRRTWWMIYVLDRSLALELGRPTLIDETDCDVSLPVAVDDHYIHDTGIAVPNGAEPLTHSLLAIIHVVRSYASLNKSLSSPIIAATRLSTFDQHFNACLRTFPPICDVSSAVRLAPHLLNPLIYLLNARLLLHRHNLAPACPANVRLTAIDECTHTAVQTASYISRTREDLPSSATSMLLLHTFRCALFLLFAGPAELAITCVRALASVHSRQEVTVPCGRFIAFFASTLLGKRAELETFYTHSLTPNQPPHFAPHGAVRDSLLRDEELLAYVSADLQASPETSWVWAGAAEREHPHAQQPGPPGGRTPASAAASAKAAPPPHGQLSTFETRTGLTDEEARDWGGWERLDALLNDLASRKSTPPPPPPPPLVPSSWVPQPPPPPPPHHPVMSDAVKSEPGTAHAGPILPPPIGSASSTPLQPGEGASSSGSPTTGGANSKGQDARLSIANMLQ